MDIVITEKQVMTRFVTVKGEEFELYKLIKCLDELMSTDEDDRYGDCSLKDYQVSNIEVMNKLVSIGYAKHYIGPREARLYCDVSHTETEELLDKLYDSEKEYNNSIKDCI